MLADLLTQNVDAALTRAAESLELARSIRRTAIAGTPERPWRRA